jgi:hypothetical protein
MANETLRTRYDAFFGEDFMPLIRQEQAQGAQERIAYAAEFAAFHLGQIDKKLGNLIELMEARTAGDATGREKAG